MLARTADPAVVDAAALEAAALPVLQLGGAVDAAATLELADDTLSVLGFRATAPIVRFDAIQLVMAST